MRRSSFSAKLTRKRNLAALVVFCFGISGEAAAGNYCGSPVGGEAKNDMVGSQMKINGDTNYFAKWYSPTTTQKVKTRWLNAGHKTSQWDSGRFGSSTKICDADFYWKPWDNREAAKQKISWKTGRCWGTAPNRSCRVE